MTTLQSLGLPSGPSILTRPADVPSSVHIGASYAHAKGLHPDANVDRSFSQTMQLPPLYVRQQAVAQETFTD